MSTCKTCTYWSQLSNSDFGTCELIQAIDFGYAPKTEPAFMNITADDDSNLNAELITNPSFGCNQHN